MMTTLLYIRKKGKQIVQHVLTEFLCKVYFYFLRHNYRESGLLKEESKEMYISVVLFMYCFVSKW